MDLARLGGVLRAIRIRQRLRQQEVAMRAGVSRATIARAEGGAIRSLPIETLIDIGLALGIQIDIAARWRGGDVDRFLNAGHSATHEQVSAMFARLADWLAQPEVSFAVYAERGVIDILAFRPADRALLVVEVKTELVDVNQLIGTVDRYTRLGRRVAAERGWRASAVSWWVILRGTMTNRRRVDLHSHVLRAAFPANGREARAWLRPGLQAAPRAFISLRCAPQERKSGPHRRSAGAPRSTGRKTGRPRAS
jgi:transcriptional regulator with XRE-family HTH domain